MIFEIRSNLLSRSAQPQRNRRVRDPLRRSKNVRRHFPVIHRKPFPSAAPPTHHFIRNQKHPMRVANLPQSRHVFLRRHQHAIRPNHRLHNHRRHVALVRDHVLHIFRASNPTSRISVPDRAFVAIHLRRKNHSAHFPARLHRPTPRITGSRDRSRRRPVIRPIPRNNLRLARKHPRNLESRLVSLGTGCSEKIFGQSLRQNFRKQLRQFCPHFRSITRSDKRQLLRLLLNRLNHGPILMPQIHAHQLRRKIQILLPANISEVATLRIHHLQRRPSLLPPPSPISKLRSKFLHLRRRQFPDRWHSHR